MAKTITIVDSEGNKCYPRTLVENVSGLSDQLLRIDNLINFITSQSNTDMSEVIDARVVGEITYKTLNAAINSINNKVEKLINSSIIVNRRQDGEYLGPFDNSVRYKKGDVVFFKNQELGDSVEIEEMLGDNNVIKTVEGAKATASSQLIPNAYNPQEAIDLNPDSQWACKAPPELNEFIKIELPKSCRIEEIDIAWDTFGAGSIDVSTSDDGKNFSIIKTFKNSKVYDGKGTRYLLDYPISTKHIQLTFNDAYTADVGYRIKEIAIISNSGIFYKFNKDYSGGNISDYADIFIPPTDYDLTIVKPYYVLTRDGLDLVINDSNIGKLFESIEWNFDEIIDKLRT